MKLRKLTVLTAASVLALGSASALAAGGAYITDADRTSVTIAQEGIEAGDAVFAAARFDEDGRFIDVETGYGWIYDDEQSYTYRMSSFLDSGEAKSGSKLMLWSYDENMRPLSADHPAYMLEYDDEYRMGVLEDIWIQDGNYYLKTISAKGEEVFAVDEETAQRYVGYIYTDNDGVMADNSGREKLFAPERVMSYGIEDGSFVPDEMEDYDSYAYDEQYKFSRGRLGAIRIGTSEETSILDLSDYYDNDEYDTNGLTPQTLTGSGVYAATSSEGLINETNYTAYGYGRSSFVANPEKFVLIMEGDINNGENDRYVYNKAVLEDVYSSRGRRYAKIINEFGKTEDYELTDAEAADTYANYVYTDGLGAVADNSGREKAFAAERVIEYYIDGKGCLNINTLLEGEYSLQAEYDADMNAIGGMSAYEINILDMSGYYEGDEYDENGPNGVYEYTGTCAALNSSYFEAGNLYTIYTFSSELSDEPLVMVMQGLNPLNVNASMAVYCSEAIGAPFGEDCVVITAYQDGNQVEIYKQGTEFTGMTAGDPFFYTYGSDGYADNIVELFKDTVNLDEGYDAFYTSLISDPENPFDPLSDEAKGFPEWTGGDEDSKILFGTITDKGLNYIALVDNSSFVPGTTIVNVDNLRDYALASNMNVYIYDYLSRPGSRVQTGAAWDIRETSFSRDCYVDYGGASAADKAYVDFSCSAITDYITPNYGMVSFALARVVDDEVRDILMIHPRLNAN